jgi:hypothetical protein
MAQQTSVQFEQALSLALRLSPSERLAASFRVGTETDANAQEPAFSTDEVAEMMRVEPISPQEMVAQGLLGVWADQGIEDSAAWVNEQKRPHSVLSFNTLPR